MFVLIIKPTGSNVQTMLPAVVLALGLVTTAFALPVTPEVQVPGYQGVPQTNVEVPVSQQGEKTGFQGEVYTPNQQTVPQTVQQTVQQNVQQNVPVPKVENVPVAVENQQASYTESPVLLPIQPLSVVPVSSVGQVLRPVIVPAEAIAAGRVIIMSVEPIQQRSFQEVVGQPEKQVPIQQVVQPATYIPVQTQVVEPNQQPYYVQPTEKQTPVQQTEQIQVQPNQEQLTEQNVQNVEYQNPVPQVYNVQPVVAETVPYQVPVNPHPVEPQYQVQKQGYQQATPVQGQEVSEYQQSYRPVPVENVEKQASQQPYDVQPYAVQQGQHHQVNTYSHPVEQQVYNVQPVEQHNVQHVEPQVYNVQPAEQQVHNVPAEKQGFSHVQTPYVEPQQQQPVQQVVEKQAYQQQPVQNNEYVPVQSHPAEQQVYSVESQVPYQQVSHTQVPEQKSQKPEVEQYHQVQQVETYAGQPAYNFGDKLPQIHENNPIRIPNYSVQPSSVLSAQE